jgi:hypothetical protein
LTGHGDRFEGRMTEREESRMISKNWIMICSNIPEEKWVWEINNPVPHFFKSH